MLGYIPSPLPDEVGIGYLNRVAASHAIARKPPIAMTLEALATLTKVAESSILYKHTCVGYARFTNVAQAGKPLHQHTDLRSNDKLLSVGRSPCYRYCRECMQDDSTEWGCAYLRRYHQLPGVDRCDQHDIALTEFKRFTFRGNRSACLPEGDSPAQQSSRNSPALRRFFALSMMALHCSTPSHPEHLADVLASRAQAAGLRLREQKSGRRFSELVQDLVPADWLSRHFGSTKMENTLDGLFRAYRSPYRTASYLLAMAVLWDSPQEAMAACAGKAAAGTGAKAEALGTRVLNAVLAGASIRAACRQEGGSAADLERALRELLGSKVGDAVRVLA